MCIRGKFIYAYKTRYGLEMPLSDTVRDKLKELTRNHTKITSVLIFGRQQGAA